MMIRMGWTYYLDEIGVYSEDNADFEEIVDFLNTSPIRYALTISPTVYVSYIEQFWSTTKIKTVNNETQIRVKVDGKTIVITESSVRRDLHFNDEDEPIPIVSSSSHPKKTHKCRKNKRKATEISQSSGPTTLVADKTIHEERTDSVERAATTATSLDAEQGSGNVIRTQSTTTLNEPIPQGTGLENVKDVQALKIQKLKKRVKKLDKDSETQGRYGHDIGVNTASTSITTASINITTVEPVTTASALMKSEKSKAKGVTMQEPSEFGTRVRVPPPQIDPKDKGKEKMVEPEKPKKKKELVKGSKTQKSEVDRAVPDLAAGSSKRDAEEELDQEKELQQMMIIVPEQRMNVEALQIKYPIIDREIYSEGTRKYWKIIRVGNLTEVHQFFDDMLKVFDRDDLVMLWSLVKEKFNSTEPTDDKEREIWVELKRLFEPDTDDELWKLQNHIHDVTWRLYDSYGVHHVSTEKGIDIYMLVENKYPLSRATLTLMLVVKLLVDQENEMSRELLRKIFMQAERPRR
ncbi:hypothetical protein Tco_0880701 [Tanacetum coccineum]